MPTTIERITAALDAQNNVAIAAIHHETKLALLLLAHAAGQLHPDIRYIEIQRAEPANNAGMEIDAFLSDIPGETLYDPGAFEDYDVADALRLEYKDAWTPYCVEGKGGTYYIDIRRVLTEITIEPEADPHPPLDEPMTWRDLFRLQHEMPLALVSRPVEFQNIGLGGGRFVPCIDRSPLNVHGNALQLYVQPAQSTRDQA